MIPRKDNASNKKNNELSGIAWWGAWVGLIGGLVGIVGGGINLYEKFFHPSVEVLEVLPIAVTSEKSILNNKVKVEGISAIVHLRSGSREVSITALDVQGKVYLNGNEYVGFLGSRAEGRHVNEIEQEILERKPYFHISWSAWPTDSKVPIKLGPYEDRYIRFTFLEPTTFTGMVFDGSWDEYVGFENEDKRPRRTTSRPHLHHFFKQKVVEGGRRVMSFDIRDEVREGWIELQARMGSHSVIIPPTKIKRFESLAERDWETKNPQELFLSYEF